MAEKEEKLSFKKQFSALKNLPDFLRLVWRTNKWLAAANIFLRLAKSGLPLAMLFVGKLIIDQVLFLVENQHADYSRLWQLVALEFGLAVLSDLFNRGISLVDSLLGDLFANQTSYELIKHAATLDLYQFEIT